MRGRRLVFERVLRLLYGPGAHVYDRFTEALFAGEWRRWQLAAVKEIPANAKVVELGSGTGALAELAADRVDAWIGVERSSRMIAVARKRNRPPRPMFVRADAAALPLPNAFADVVVATFPTAFIVDLTVLREAGRMLKPPGRLIVVLTGELVPRGVRRRIACAAMALAYGRARTADDHPIELLGFDGDWTWHDTEYGKTLVFVGSPTTSQDAGCSRPRDDVGEREKGHRPDERRWSTGR